MHITSDFPGGNIFVEEIAGDTVRLRQDLRDTDGDWFYWYFAVSGAAGRTVTFEFTGGPAIGARGPAWSVDGGATWQWLGLTEDRNRFVFVFPSGVDTVRFCMTIPYTAEDWEKFLARHAGRENLRPGRLCESRKRRAVDLLTVGAAHQAPRVRAVLVARHHSCETMGSFALEGLLEYVLASDEAEAVWLREKGEFVVIPFLDKDGVEDGDQGKNRRPRDHNRDYGSESLYPETAAVRALLASASDPFAVALDFHCPWLCGGRNEAVYLVGSRDPVIWKAQQEFSAILERKRRGLLPFLAADNLPFGQEWNVAESFTKGLSFGDWASRNPGIRLSASLEVPYANARGVEVNAATARALGVDLGRALAQYASSVCV
jgi:hypothetical protein